MLQYNYERDRFLPPSRREEDLKCICGECPDDSIECDPEDYADRYNDELVED